MMTQEAYHALLHPIPVSAPVVAVEQSIIPPIAVGKRKRESSSDDKKEMRRKKYEKPLLARTHYDDILRMEATSGVHESDSVVDNRGSRSKLVHSQETEWDEDLLDCLANNTPIHQPTEDVRNVESAPTTHATILPTQKKYASSAQSLLGVAYVLNTLSPHYKDSNVADDNPFYQSARSFHRHLYDLCIENGKYDDDQDWEDALRDYHRKVKEISSLSLPTLWELMTITNNFVINLHHRTTLTYPKVREELMNRCGQLYTKFMDEEIDNGPPQRVQLNEERNQLAWDIVREDDQQEIIYKRIERVGFDLFLKVKHRIQLLLRGIFQSWHELQHGVSLSEEDPDFLIYKRWNLFVIVEKMKSNEKIWKKFKRLLRRKLEQVEAVIDGLSISFGDVLKRGREEMKEIADMFESSFGICVEDIVDKDGNDSQKGDEDDEDSGDDGIGDGSSDEDYVEVDLGVILHPDGMKQKGKTQFLIARASRYISGLLNRRA